MESEVISEERSTLQSHVVQPSDNTVLFPNNIPFNLLLLQNNEKALSLSFDSSWSV